MNKNKWVTASFLHSKSGKSHSKSGVLHSVSGPLHSMSGVITLEVRAAESGSEPVAGIDSMEE